VNSFTDRHAQVLLSVSPDTIRNKRKELESLKLIKIQDVRVGKDNVTRLIETSENSEVPKQTEEQKREEQYQQWFDEHVLVRGDALEVRFMGVPRRDC
jgi:hypothetical protein